VPGITIALDDGKGFQSDAAGQVVLAVGRAGIHGLTASVPAPTATTRVTFMRWSDDSWTASRPIRVVQDVSISVGLRLAYLTPIQFVDLDFHPLDPSLVNGVVLSGPNAELIQPQYPYDPIWLQTPLPAKHSGESGLHITPAPYSLSFAKYDRLNVASVGQMRFTPSLNGTWKIQLLLFTLRLGAKDALFGTTLDNPIRLTGPTGRIQTVMLDRHGRNTLVLGRGNYSAQVLASGLTPIAPIALSRSQEVIVPVVTPADFFLMFVILFAIAVAVFVAGRGRLWAFGRLSAVRVQVGEPLLQGLNTEWERRSPQRVALQRAAGTSVDRLRSKVLASARWWLLPAQMPSTNGSSVGASLKILDDGRVPVVQPGAALTVEGNGVAPPDTSGLPGAVTVLPRSYMLADEAGVGETIEVGLIIRDILTSHRAERFLLLVHQSVMRQWQQELMAKFGLRVPRFERGTFFDHDDRELEWSGNPWRAFPLLLASSHLARRRDRRNELLAGGSWDAVIVDDAHEAHRSGSTRHGAPNKLLAALQAMKAGGSWKALYLASPASTAMHLNQALDLMDLLGMTQMRTDVADELAHYFAIPPTERKEGDWGFLTRLCTRFFSETDTARPGGRTKAKAQRSTRSRTRQRIATDSAPSVAAAGAKTEQLTRP
jgi:hypothetical protein